MVLKLNISEKGKAWKIEVEPAVLSGKSIGDKFDGKTIRAELEGYELEITGGSDFSGFPMDKEIEGIGLKRVLRTKGWGMWSKPKGLKKKQPRLKKGMRLRKTARGRTISDKTVQLNINVIKAGSKKLSEIFPDQNKAPEPKAEEKPAKMPSEEKPVEEKKEEPKTEETTKVEEKSTEAPKEEPKKEKPEETK